MSQQSKDGFVPLREYLEARLGNIERATDVAYKAMDKRLEGMNEFRQALTDQKASFVTRIELRATIDKLDADIETLKLSKATLEGKASQTSFYISMVFGTVGAISGIVSLLR